jgi:hypothetical protein
MNARRFIQSPRRQTLGHIASLARSYTDTAIKTLAGIMMAPSAPASARIAAAAILLDRGWGKAKEMHEHSGPDNNPIKKIVHEFVHLNPMSPDELAAAEDEPVLIEWRDVRDCVRNGNGSNGHEH